jgi:hypothetical protein
MILPRNLAALVALVLGLGLEATAAPSPERRALDFLAREVPRWSRENHCFSCHNNGDAAQALYAALRASEPLAPEVLADTNRWLAVPEGWEHNGGDGPFSDKRLARLQFAAALAGAVAAGQVPDRTGLIRAAGQLGGDQAADGAFLLEGGNALGSPATYGRALATRVLRDTLRAADPERFRAAIEKAERWLVGMTVESLLDASAVLPVVSGPAGADLPGAAAQRARCLDLIRRGQSTDGGWGPYASSPPEPFDTAVVVLALMRFVKAEPSMAEPGLHAQIERGRAFLVANQNADGSWTETTRPAGNVSYAQQLSTTGWATQALLATRGSN